MTRAVSLRSRGLIAISLALPLAGAVGPTIARAAPMAGCVVQITAFAFHPSTAAEGTSTTLDLKVKNCTNKTQRVTLTQFGTEPPGCPVLDPVAQPATLRPGRVFVRNQTWIAPNCTGTESITVTISGPHGMQLANRTAHLTVTA